jgi:hypothetical protein
MYSTDSTVNLLLSRVRQEKFEMSIGNPFFIKFFRLSVVVLGGTPI